MDFTWISLIQQVSQWAGLVGLALVVLTNILPPSATIKAGEAFTATLYTFSTKKSLPIPILGWILSTGIHFATGMAKKARELNIIDTDGNPVADKPKPSE